MRSRLSPLSKPQALDLFLPMYTGAEAVETAIKAARKWGLAERSASLGDYFLERLRSFHSHNIREVRSRGLWIGVELNGLACPFCEALISQRILCKETHDRVLRISPPLVIEKEELDWAFDRFREVLLHNGVRRD